MNWRPIETIPSRDIDCPRLRVLLYSKQLGVTSGEAGNFRGKPWANVASFCGDAVELWGVTHWMPLPAPPIATTAPASSEKGE